MLNEHVEVAEYAKSCQPRRKTPSRSFIINFKSMLFNSKSNFANYHFNENRMINMKFASTREIIDKLNIGNFLGESSSCCSCSLTNNSKNLDISNSEEKDECGSGCSQEEYSECSQEEFVTSFKQLVKARRGVILNILDNSSFFASPTILAKLLNYDRSTINYNFKLLFECDKRISRDDVDYNKLKRIFQLNVSWHKYYTKNGGDVFDYLNGYFNY